MDATRGGTLLLPASHLIGHGPDPRDEQDWQRFSDGAIPVEASTGDVLLYVGQCWHSVNTNLGISTTTYPGGHNGVRSCVLGQWLPYYFSAMEDHQWRTPERVIEQMPALSRKLLGFDHRLPGDQRRLRGKKARL